MQIQARIRSLTLIVFNLYIIETETKIQEKGKGQPLFYSWCQFIYQHFVVIIKKQLEKTKLGTFGHGKEPRMEDKSGHEEESHAERQAKVSITKSWRPLDHVNSFDPYSAMGKQ